MEKITREHGIDSNYPATQVFTFDSLRIKVFRVPVNCHQFIPCISYHHKSLSLHSLQLCQISILEVTFSVLL